MMTKINIPAEVMATVKAADEQKKRQEWTPIVKAAVAYKQAVVVSLEGLDNETAKLLNSKDIKLIPVENNKGEATGLFAIFNGPEIDGREKADQIEICVPKGKEGLVMGSGKWQLKEWVHTSWLRRRHISRIWVKGV